MKKGRMASLKLAVALGLVSAATGILLHDPSALQAWLLGQGVVLRGAVLIGIPCLIFLIMLIPLGIAHDRAIARLSRALETRADGQAEIGKIDAPGWLQPVVNVFSTSVERMAGECRQLRDQLSAVESRTFLVEAQKKQSEAVLHTFRDAVIVTDVSDQIIMANDAAAELFKFDVHEAANRSLESIIHHEKLRQLIHDTRQVGDIGQCRHAQIHINLPVDTTTSDMTQKTNFDVCLTCVGNQSGDVGSVVAVLHDMTHEQELSELKTDFVSKASHELRTPLASIRAYIEMLIDGETSDESSRQEFYRVIQDEAGRLSRLIDYLLNISRIEAGIVQIEKKVLSINALVDQAVSSISPQARNKGIEISLKLSPEGLRLEGDRDMLHQVVLNLVSNAVKYTPERGKVTIVAEKDTLTPSILVSVIDTGMGISPDEQRRIFDKFYRIDNYKQLAPGTGLGLTLCKHIVETLHHGHIGVESKLGMGAKFWFTIPLRQTSPRIAA